MLNLLLSFFMLGTTFWLIGIDEKSNTKKLIGAITVGIVFILHGLQALGVI